MSPYASPREASRAAETKEKDEVKENGNTNPTKRDVGFVSALSNGALERLPFLGLPVRDHVKTFLLLLLAIVTLPLTYVPAILLTILPPSWIVYIFPLSLTTPSAAINHRANCRASPHFRERTVLVTGTTMTKGLTLARAFYLCGHRVIAADFDGEKSGAWTGGQFRGAAGWRFSQAFDGLYSLKRPAAADSMDKREYEEIRRTYVRDLCTIVREERVDLWVSCSGVASALEDAMVRETVDSRAADSEGIEGKEARRPKGLVQFDVATTAKLHEKSSFIRCAKDMGLPVPETHDVASHHEVLEALESAVEGDQKRKFILKPVGMDDLHRGVLKLLPLTTREDTEAYVQGLPISKDRPWILQQFIGGGREYCTHSLVVDGEVKVFVACPSSELLMHYQALPADDPLSMAMLQFTRVFARTERQTEKSFTGHLSFDFMAEDDESGKTSLYAIECNPRAHTAVALFSTPGADMRAMVDAYMSAIDSPLSSSGEMGQASSRKQSRVSSPVTPPADVEPRFWIAHDLVTKAVLPLLRLLRWRLTASEVLRLLRELRQQVQHGRDATFELWDPWPFVALYHHYWPWAILAAWWKGERWSRLNVSTTKMFAC